MPRALPNMDRRDQLVVVNIYERWNATLHRAVGLCFRCLQFVQKMYGYNFYSIGNIYDDPFG